MKKVIMLFAAAVLLASTSFATVNPTSKADNGRMLTSSKPMAKKLVKPNSLKKATKVAGNPVWQDTMSYCLDADFYTGVGTQAAGDTVYWAIKIEAAALAGRNNLTDVEFFVAYAGTYNLAIYSGTQPTGTAAYTQTINAVAADTMKWKNVHFTSPLAITQGADLWVVLSNTDVAYPAAAVNPNTYDNGKWISLDGIQWMSVANAGVDATWMIRAISDTYAVQPPMVSISGPANVRTGDTVVYTAVSPNTDSYDWTISSDYLNDNGNTATVMWNSEGAQQVIVTATNTAGTTYDTLDVNVYSCEDLTVPYTAVFGEDLGCWDTVCDSTHGAGWYTTAEMGLTEGQVLSMSGYDPFGIGWIFDLNVDNWLISPEIEMDNSNSYEIAWQVKPFEPSYDGDHYGVYVISNGDTILLFEESLTGMTGYTQRMAIIPDSISGDFKFAFRHFNCQDGYVIILDSIQVRELTAPTVALNGPTSVENGESATFTALCGNAESYAWTINGTAQTETGNVLTTTFTTDTNYTVKVIATNSVGSDSASMSVEVYSCQAITEFPYTQDFEDGTRCWTMVSMDPSNDDLFGIYEDGDAFGGDYDFRFSSYSHADDYNQYLISPELTLPTEGTYVVKFQYRGYRAADAFRIMASSTDRNPSSFTEIADYPTVATTWTLAAAMLPAGTKYVAINYYGDYAYYLFVDNITIGELNEAPEVTLDGPASALVDDEVTFVANAPLATSFSWTINGTAQAETGNVLTTTFTASGEYTVAVTATNAIGSNNATATITVISCDDPVSAPWSEGFEENTMCWQFVTPDGISNGFVINPNGQYQYSRTGNYCLFGTYSDDVDVDQWAISPAISMPANANGYKLAWYVYTTAWDGIQTKYEVRVSTTGSDINDFNTVLFTEQDSAHAYVQRVVNMSQYAGQTIRLAFRNLTPRGGDAMMFDDIELSSNVVGIDNANTIHVAIYPNPVSDKLNIEGEGIQMVQVLDINGRNVISTEHAGSIDMSSLANGVYVVRVVANDGIRVKKIVKK